MWVTFPLILNFLGTQEFLLVMLAILFLFGPKKIPELARSLGKMMRRVRDARENIMTEIRKGGLEVDETKETFQRQILDAKKEVTDIKNEVQKEFDKVNNTISRTK